MSPEHLLHEISPLIGQYWWVAVGLAVMIVLVAAARRGRQVQRDPKRLFTSAERQEASRRAGGRCEHKSVIWFRCSAPGTHGDHIYPWSRGGATVMMNHQWLCAKHNLRKSDHVPSRVYIWRLERRRKSYFPQGVDPHVDWRVRV